MILKGDCIKIMKALKPNSVDAIVTDPPYGLSFMNKGWDNFKPEYLRKCMKREEKRIPPIGHTVTSFQESSYAGSYDFSPKGNKVYQKEMEKWLTEAYRVLKPGGSMLVMGGTRTSHRLACAIEDSGFIIKDTIMFMYGSGFPKCQDITPMIDGKMLGITTKQVKERREKIGKDSRPQYEGFYDKWDKNYPKRSKKFGKGEWDITKSLTPEAKHWDGFKVGGIKPAYEPIIWAVKPPEGSYVDNVLKWGVGAVNVTETRIGLNGEKPPSGSAKRVYKANQYTEDKIYGDNKITPNKGRFPANVILSHHPECVQVGMKKVKDKAGNKRDSKNDFDKSKSVFGIGYSGGCSPRYGEEQVESWDCHPDCAIFILDQQSGMLKSGKDNIRRKEGFFIEHGKLGKAGDVQVSYGDNGGASKFFLNIKPELHCSLCKLPLRMGNDMISNKEIISCNVNIANKNLSQSEGGQDSVQCPVQQNIQQGKEGKSGKSNKSAFSAKKNSLNMQAIKENIVRHNVDLNLVEQLAQNVKSAGNLCDLCAISIAHALVAIKTSDFNQGELEAILDYMTNYERCILIQNLVVFVELWGNIDIIPTIQSLSLLFGSVQNAIRDFTPPKECAPIRFKYTPKASRGERNAGLEGMEEKTRAGINKMMGNEKGGNSMRTGSGKIRNNKLTNSHPTVKPIKLFEYLIKLVTREGQTILDPFIGSGTTAIAAHNTGRKCVGIEKEDEYLTIAKRRIDYWKNQPKQMEMRI